MRRILPNTYSHSSLCTRAEKERAQMRGETEDLRMQLEQAIKQRGSGKPSKEVEAQIADLQQRLDVRLITCTLVWPTFMLSCSQASDWSHYSLLYALLRRRSTHWSMRWPPRTR